jgi:site-specific DNA-cytosine methylase
VAELRHLDLFSGIGGFALAALGNSIVSQIAEVIFRSIDVANSGD